MHKLKQERGKKENYFLQAIRYRLRLFSLVLHSLDLVLLCDIKLFVVYSSIELTD
jgi:hypothetical protein